MKPMISCRSWFGLMVLAAFGIGDASADAQPCTRTQDGSVVCGAADTVCKTDRRGEVFCSTPGGGLLFDRLGAAQCGPGHCVRDQRGEVWCSATPRGGAATDRNGRAHCTDSCVRATVAACVRPRPAR